MAESPSSVSLDKRECLTLLGFARVGRMVFTEAAMPSVHPVNFVMDANEVIIRTSGGAKLASAMRNDVVAFEADEIDPRTHTGWSVVVVGRASVVRDIDRLVRLGGPGGRPWVDGRTDHVIRIEAERLTGRRLALVGGEPHRG